MRDGQWVALLAWGPCCYALQDRDDWIGWSRTFRATRQKLVVQLRRLLIPEATREPNLASQALGAVTRELPALWEKRFGYRPVLATTFSDREVHAGTCYRAAGWLPVGESKGYARHRLWRSPKWSRPCSVKWSHWTRRGWDVFSFQVEDSGRWRSGVRLR